jgi:3-deoxy-7-phosphoheptulonate synthase
VTKEGHSAIVHTTGNEDCHVILRGGRKPNYDAANVELACKQLSSAGLAKRVMIDMSHSNSEKEFRKQLSVGHAIAEQIADGDDRIMGVMIESHLKEGRQDLTPGKDLSYGQSITDACIGWEDTVAVLDELAQAVRARRIKTEARD